jgi:hypothetical protein
VLALEATDMSAVLDTGGQWAKSSVKTSTRQARAVSKFPRRRVCAPGSKKQRRENRRGAPRLPHATLCSSFRSYERGQRSASASLRADTRRLGPCPARTRSPACAAPFLWLHPCRGDAPCPCQERGREGGKERERKHPSSRPTMVLASHGSN